MKTYRHSLDRLCENNIDLIKRGIAMSPKPAVDTYNLFLQLEMLELVLGAKKDKKPNKTTEKTFEDTDKGKNLEKHKDVREIFKKNTPAP